MKAAICEKYGPPEVLKIKEIDKPTPKKGEVLIKVIASSVNSGDARVRALRVDGPLSPLIKVMMRLIVGVRGPRNKVLGVVVAGIIEELGEGVTQFKVGDEVYAMTGFKFGGHAEYATLPAHKSISLKPIKASFEEAAAIPFGGTTAMYFLRKAKIKSSSKVLIYGSTGAVGTAAVQLARIKGGEVTAICGKDGLALSKKLGALKVHDYKLQRIDGLDDRYDIVFDAVGKISKKECQAILANNGVFVTVASLDVASEKASDLEELARHFNQEKFVAVIDKTYTLDEIVEAHRYVDLGRKKGSVVITI